MSRRGCIAGALLGAWLGGVGVPAWANGPDGDDFAKGRIIVMPRAGLPDAELGKIVGVHGGKARRIGQSRLYIVELPATASERSVVERLAHNPHLKFAELDRRFNSSFVPNDPYFGSQWHLPKIGAPTAHDLSLGSGITIAILDTGVDASHPDLTAQIVPGWNFYDKNSNTADVTGHGTAVAGAAAAAIDNAVGVASVAGRAKIMPIRISAPDGWAYASTVAEGITYAADKGVRVANVSYNNMAGNLTVQNAAQYMKNRNGLVVVSAGNSGTTDSTKPTTTLIPVSATDSNDRITSWSTRGDFVAVSAPGVDIWTTRKGGSYSNWWGTSFSSPITAGVVALMMAARPTLPATDVESLLFKTATDLGTAGRDPDYGHGRVNAAAAVQAAAGASGSADTQPPSASIADPVSGASVSGLVAVNVSASDNVGVAKVELRVNDVTVATDTSSPFAFSWDSSKVANGSATLVAKAYDAAGNAATSAPVSVTVANTTTSDTTPPKTTILNPKSGSKVKAKGNVTIDVAASDDGGSAGITQSLYINGVLVATATGASLSYNWNMTKTAAGSHTIKAVASDAARNTASTSITVTK